MSRKRIIIDCDPGVDDAVAILLALASPAEIELLGITTVAGNVPLELTTRNALRICELADCPQIPVFPGCSGAMTPAPWREPSVHGIDGLGDVGLGEPRTAAQTQHAVDFIIETVNRYPGEVTLCPIGPMTNIARVLQQDPAAASKIRRIVFMGGAAFCPGNATPAAEFNFWLDPDAAQIVLKSGIPCVMLGLDVTNQAVITNDRLSSLRNIGSGLAMAIADMVESYSRGDPCLHDACAVAYLLDPSLFSGGLAKVDVECDSDVDRGRTMILASTSHHPAPDANCEVITSVDSNRLFHLLNQRLLDR